MINRHQLLRRNDEEEEPCSHSVYIKGLCGNCGARLDPPQSTSVSMIHSVPELKVSEEYAKEIGKADQERLIQQRKLVLLVDLDQTILHTTHEKVESDPNVHSFTLWPGHPTYYTKLRPYLQEFLDQMSQIYELHIFTFGCRLYAHKIASIIDPEQKYFGNRILSRDESVDQYSKKGNLNNLFPCGDAMVCIIDDRSDVWRDAGNLIQVKPYSYFKTSISDGAMRAGNSSAAAAAAAAEDEESLERDVDALEALLGLEEEGDEEKEEEKEEEDEGASKKKLKCDSKDTDEENSSPPSSSSSSTTTTATATTTTIAPTIQKDNESDGTTPPKITAESTNNPEQLQKTTSETSDSNEATVTTTTPTATATTTNEDSGGKEVEKEDGENKIDSNVELDGEESSSQESSSSAKIEEDPDDHLLYLPSILTRIHNKWYKELDWQRADLLEGESYKLPDIKDIIRTYLRKRY